MCYVSNMDEQLCNDVRKAITIYMIAMAIIIMAWNMVTLVLTMIDISYYISTLISSIMTLAKSAAMVGAAAITIYVLK